MNPAGLLMIGVTDEGAILGTHYLERVGAADVPHIAGRWQAALHGESSEFEFVGVNQRVYRSNFVPLPDGTIMGISLDITERRQQKAALQESEQRFRAIFEQAAVGVALIDTATGRLLRVNRKYCELLQYTSDELLQLDSMRLTYPEDLAPDLAYMERLKSGELAEFSLEKRLICKNGSTMWVNLTVSPMWSRTSPPTNHIAIIEDISEKKASAVRELQRLDQLKRMSELALTLSGDPAAVFEHIVRIVGELYAVKVVCLSEIIGEELHFRAVFVNGQVILNAGHCPLAVTPCATVKETKDLRIYDRVAERFPEATFLHDHNADSYCGIPSLDHHGNVIAITCLLDDQPHEFSEEDQHLLRVIGQRIAAEIEQAGIEKARQQAENSLRASEHRTRQVLDGLFGFVGLYTLEGTLIDANRAPLEAAGLTREEVLGKPFWETYWWNYDPQVQAEVKDALTRAAHGEVVRYEPTVRMTGGALMDIDCTFCPLREPDGSVSGVVGFAVDITEKKRSDAALRGSEQRLKEAQALAHIGSWDLDLSQNRLQWSDEIFQIFEIDPLRFEASYEGFLYTVHPEDREKVDRAYRDSVANHSSYEITHRLLMTDGRIKWVNERSTTDYDSDGRPQRSRGTVQEVTERPR